MPLNPTETSFLTQLRDALTDALTPAVAPPPPPPPPPPPVTTTGPLLASTRLKYNGLFKLPYIPGVTQFGFSVGAFTARRVNNQLQFLAAGFKNSNFPVVEFAFPGVGTDLASAPRATMLTNWGSCYVPMVVASSGQVGSGVGLRALHWDANSNVLYWFYGDEYNAAGAHDPCVGATILNADGTFKASGTWRTQEHSQKTRGYALPIPAAFQQAYKIGPVGMGCPNTSGNASSPWGVFLATGALPAFGTPPDPVTDQTKCSIANQRLIYHDISKPQSRNTNYKFCGYTVKYDPTKGGTIAPGTPTWLDIDQVTAMVWVDLPDVQGVVAIGQVVDTIPGYAYEDGDTQTHVWYGPPICVHGQNGGPVSNSVGPAAGSMVPKAWFYDPAVIAKVAAGQLDPNAIQPTEEVQLATMSRLAARAHTNYQFGGAYFDAPTRSIFISETFVDNPDPYSPCPVIHQFLIV